MKTHWTVGLVLCAVAAAANAQLVDGGRPHVGIAGAPSLVLPVAIQDDDHSDARQLRDVLRQSPDNTQELGSKPHRLSPQERLRLREQLRNQPDAGQIKDKSW